MKSGKLKLMSVLGLIVLLGGCATTPEQVPELEQARSAVQALASDPLAEQAASEQVKAAREALARADEAMEKGEPSEYIVHLAYVTDREAQIGQAQVAEARAREQITQAEAERNRVLLQSRERET